MRYIILAFCLMLLSGCGHHCRKWVVTEISNTFYCDEEVDGDLEINCNPIRYYIYCEGCGKKANAWVK